MLNSVALGSPDVGSYSNGCPRGPDFMLQTPAIGITDNKAGSGFAGPCGGVNICQLESRRSDGMWGTGFPDFHLLCGLLGGYLSSSVTHVTLDPQRRPMGVSGLGSEHGEPIW